MASVKIRRNTPQRKMVLEELCKMTSHPTAAELYAVVRRRLPRISLGTVYRNLEILHEDSMILKLEFAGAESRFDGNAKQHYHVRCTECGRVDDIHSLDTDQGPAQPAELAGYLIAGHRLEYFGTCPDCQNKKPFPGPQNNPGH